MSDTRSQPAGSMPGAVRPITIVTGGARGIGAATVAHLARSGHDVVVGYRDDRASAMRTVAAAQRHGVRAVAVAGDVTDEGDVAELFAAAAELGAVTGLVNNAGLTAPGRRYAHDHAGRPYHRGGRGRARRRAAANPADDAKAGCAVSRALAGVAEIVVTASLSTTPYHQRS
jgi:NAD(P)-dependent dehydrogenase (short-subunit alcohol dehydrogenase family)